jgi:hypothetical protein
MGGLLNRPRVRPEKFRCNWRMLALVAAVLATPWLSACTTLPTFGFGALGIGKTGPTVSQFTNHIDCELATAIGTSHSAFARLQDYDFSASLLFTLQVNEANGFNPSVNIIHPIYGAAPLPTPTSVPVYNRTLALGGQSDATNIRSISFTYSIDMRNLMNSSKEKTCLEHNEPVFNPSRILGDLGLTEILDNGFDALNTTAQHNISETEQLSLALGNIRRVAKQTELAPDQIPKVSLASEIVVHRLWYPTANTCVPALGRQPGLTRDVQLVKALIDKKISTNPGLVETSNNLRDVVACLMHQQAALKVDPSHRSYLTLVDPLALFQDDLETVASSGATADVVAYARAALSELPGALEGTLGTASVKAFQNVLDHLYVALVQTRPSEAPWILNIGDAIAPTSASATTPGPAPSVPPGSSATASASPSGAAGAVNFSTSVNFLVLTGINGGPNWTLVHFKGPSAGGAGGGTGSGTGAVGGATTSTGANSGSQNLLNLSRNTSDSLTLTLTPVCRKTADSAGGLTSIDYWGTLPSCAPGLYQNAASAGLASGQLFRQEDILRSLQMLLQ